MDPQYISIITALFFIVIRFFPLVVLLLLTLKTKSKSITLIAVTYTFLTLFKCISVIFQLFARVFIDNFQLVNELYRILYFFDFFTTILSYSLFSIGVFLCYKEWKQGKLIPNELNTNHKS